MCCFEHTYRLQERERHDELDGNELANGLVVRHVGLEGHGDHEDGKNGHELRNVFDDINLIKISLAHVEYRKVKGTYP